MVSVSDQTLPFLRHEHVLPSFNRRLSLNIPSKADDQQVFLICTRNKYLHDSELYMSECADRAPVRAVRVAEY